MSAISKSTILFTVRKYQDALREYLISKNVQVEENVPKERLREMIQEYIDENNINLNQFNHFSELIWEITTRIMEHLVTHPCRAVDSLVEEFDLNYK